ncbi:myb-like protein X [Drosophila willistoni]|uniref:myb-like protein X n=1 Tax=Drosophila willistoni TaxID=7260 RepID=UPI00017D9DFB|nr:myb-like protein X [Drosophila willistoni]
MDSINPDDFSKSQLQIWCKNLGLPDTGTKNVLAERLNQLSPVARGQHPKDGAAPNGGLSKRADPPEKDSLEHLKSILYSSDDGAGQTQNFEEDLFQGQQQQEVTANEQNEAENGQNEAENDQNDAENESITNEPQEISKATNEKSNEKSNNGERNATNEKSNEKSNNGERNATNEKSNEKSNNGERNGTNEKSNEESQKEENIVKQG